MTAPHTPNRAAIVGQVTGRSVARWPARVVQLADRSRSGAGGRRIRSELWTLVQTALSRYVRVHASRLGRFDHETLRDVAAEKLLELIARHDGQWEAEMWTDPVQLCSVLSTAARNGVVDRIRKASRERVVDDVARFVVRDPGPGPGAVDVVDRRVFVDHLLGCVEGLSNRVRIAWVLRALLDLPTRRIASHPAVGMSVPAVDMALSRARGRIRDCMRRKGHATDRVPPGAFVELWVRFRRDLVRLGGEEDGS